MTEPTLIQEISAKNADLDKFVRLAVENEHIRAEIMRQMLTNPDIMVYYHCYEVVSKASEIRPELFSAYWGEVAALLKHPNSYHRDIALTVIANLTRVDAVDSFAALYADYFGRLNDDKFMTGQCCVRNSLKILQNKPAYREQILALLLDVERACSYPPKQKELLKCDILEVLAEVYADLSEKTPLEEFIKACAGSLSPKTRRRARELIKQFDIQV